LSRQPIEGLTSSGAAARIAVAYRPGRLRRPSPATVISLIALFVAVGGTSYAAINLAPRNSVNSASVINGSLQKVDLSKRAEPPALPGRPEPPALPGPQVPQGSPARVALRVPSAQRGATGPSGAAATKLFALLKGTGAGVTLLRSSGVVSATRSGAGTYIVTFNRDLAGCVPVIGQGTEGNFFDGVVFVNEANITADKVLVTTHNLSGGIVDGEAGLAVFC